MTVSNSVYRCTQAEVWALGDSGPCGGAPCKAQQGARALVAQPGWGPVPGAFCWVGVARAVQGAPSLGPETQPGRDLARVLLTYLFKI